MKTSALAKVFRSAWLPVILLWFGSPLSLRAQSPPPDDGGWTFPTNLNSWTFTDTNTWASDLAYPAVSFQNLTHSLMGDIGSGVSLWLDSPDAAWLQYNVTESDGTTNLTVETGTLLLWFAPNWASANTNQNGNGPGVAGRLLEVGAYTSDASYGLWSLQLDAAGTNLMFVTQTNSGDGVTITNLSVTVDWASNVWHNLTLTYTPTNSQLYLDGALVTNGVGVTLFPGPDVRANGFFLGSDSTGTLQAHGMFDDVFTLDTALDATNVATLYSALAGNYSINIYNVQGRIPSAPPVPFSGMVFNALSGIGWLQWVGSASNCVTSSEVWLTNSLAAWAGSGTNRTISHTFSIAGGTSGIAYDVFATAALSPTEPAYGWAWLGQGATCNLYTMTNLPAAGAFTILGTPLDSDNDGLTDAYERLVSKTDPYNPDTDGDGWSDYFEAISGLAPLSFNAAPSLGSTSTCPVP